MTRKGQSWITGFRQGLQELGWTDGRDVQFDVRWGGADIDYIRASAADLVTFKAGRDPGLFGPRP